MAYNSADHLIRNLQIQYLKYLAVKLSYIILLIVMLIK